MHQKLQKAWKFSSLKVELIFCFDFSATGVVAAYGGEGVSPAQVEAKYIDIHVGLYKS